MDKIPRVRKSEIPQEVVDLSRRIEAIMTAKKIKLTDLSQRMNMESPNLRRYIAGRQEMKYTMLLRFAKGLGVEACELLPPSDKSK